MLPFIVTPIIISFIIFARVYGPGLITAFLETKEEQKWIDGKAASAAEIERLNALLCIAFGGVESRDLEMPLEVDCEYLDSELELILENDALTTSQALAQITELLNREVTHA